MMPLTFLFDEYIDRPKLTEQKKPIWEYSSFPPQVGLEQQVHYSCANNFLNLFSESLLQNSDKESTYVFLLKTLSLRSIRL